MYHEIVTTTRTFLRNVCPVEARHVEPVIAKLRGLDVHKLSGGRTAAMAAGAAYGEEAKKVAEAKADSGEAVGAEKEKRRNTDNAVNAARARYLARKVAAGGKKKK